MVVMILYEQETAGSGLSARTNDTIFLLHIHNSTKFSRLHFMYKHFVAVCQA